MTEIEYMICPVPDLGQIFLVLETMVCTNVYEIKIYIIKRLNLLKNHVHQNWFLIRREFFTERNIL